MLGVALQALLKQLFGLGHFAMLEVNLGKLHQIDRMIRDQFKASLELIYTCLKIAGRFQHQRQLGEDVDRLRQRLNRFIKKVCRILQPALFQKGLAYFYKIQISGLGRHDFTKNFPGLFLHLHFQIKFAQVNGQIEVKRILFMRF